jgi:hypothetical protein
MYKCVCGIVLALLSTLVSIYRTGGVSRLFGGNLANCLRIAPFQAIEFSLFDMLK